MSERPPADFLTPRELAAKIGFAVGTIYNHLGRWGAEEGVYRFGNRARIDWNVWFAKWRAGEIEIGGSRGEHLRG